MDIEVNVRRWSWLIQHSPVEKGDEDSSIVEKVTTSPTNYKILQFIHKDTQPQYSPIMSVSDTSKPLYRSVTITVSSKIVKLIKHIPQLVM